MVEAIIERTNVKPRIVSTDDDYALEEKRTRLVEKEIPVISISGAGKKNQ